MLSKDISIPKAYTPIESLVRCMLVLPELNEAWGAIPASTQEAILQRWANCRALAEQKFPNSRYASAGAWADLVVEDILQRSSVGPALTSLSGETRKELRGMFRGAIVAYGGAKGNS